MVNSKLLNLLRTLTKEEFKAFGQFLHSPYFHSPKRIQKLFKYLSPGFPQFKHRKLQEEKMWYAFFPQKAFDKKKLSDLFSEVTVVLFHFLAIENFTRDESRVREETIDQLRSKGYHRYAVKKCFLQEKDLLQLETDKILDSKKAFQLSQVYQERYYHPQHYKYTSDNQLLDKAAYRLRESYLANYLQLLCESINRNRIVKSSEALVVEDHFFEQCSEYPKNSMVQVYFTLYQILQKTDIRFFKKAWPYLNEKMKLMSKKQEWTILQSLINHIGFLYRQGKPELASDLLSLFKQGLERSVFIENNQLEGSTFLNIAIVAAVVKDFSYIESLIENHRHQLPEGENNDIIHLVNAYTLSHQEKYEEALTSLHKIEDTKKIYIKLRMKCLEVRCLYEKSRTDRTYLALVLARLDAFTQYLRRNKALSESNVDSYKNFIQVTRKLLIQRQNNSDKGLTTLLDDLNTIQPLVVKLWLEQKIREAMPPES